MLIDFKLEGKTVVAVGGGSESYRKLQSFINSGAKIWVISKSFSDDVEKLGEARKVDLVRTEIKDPKTFYESLNPKPDVFLAVTDDPKLNLDLIKTAKSTGTLVYAVDNPAMSDFILPAVAKIGEVRIAVSTGGKSPAVARVLRQRIEKMITEEDMLEIQLQSFLRGILKERVLNHKARREILNEILNNVEIKQALKEEKLREAQEITIKLLEKKGELAS